MTSKFIQKILLFVFSGICYFSCAQAVAQVDLGTADAARVRPEQQLPVAPSLLGNNNTLPEVNRSDTPIPEGAKSVRFVLRKIKIEGATVFTEESLKKTYVAFIGQEIGLDQVYKIADSITDQYKEAGYFLSLAYIPDQSIDDGKVTIKVIEGYVAEVNLAPNTPKNRILQDYIKALVKLKPLKADQLESFLLTLNGFFGHSFSGVLSSSEKQGALRLSLIEKHLEGFGSIGIDNLGSNFLGPQRVSASYLTSFFPGHQTSFSSILSLPTDELKAFAVEHKMLVASNTVLSVVASRTDAAPGSTLKPFDIKSNSTALQIGLEYQWIRQRFENLTSSLLFEGRNSNTDLLDTALTRDRTRALRFGLAYDKADLWAGRNYANIAVSQGIDGLGSTGAGDTNLSRAAAKPDFTKIEISTSRLQALGQNWSLFVKASGQTASGPLLSAEEFGYGGQSFGRAYSSSEITGDHGIAASIELRYSEINVFPKLDILPYGFYDVGSVWNEDDSQAKHESGVSAGLGMRLSAPLGINGDLAVAWPLTRDAENPLYHQDERSPRFLFQMSKSF